MSMADATFEGNSMNESALDRIYIRDLLVRCLVGINPDERVNQQDIIINLVLHADLRKACQSDDIADTVDYKTIKKQVLELVQNSSFLLVERLAQAVADVCLEHPGVRRCEVTIDKPGALRFARSVAVSITRDRANG